MFIDDVLVFSSTLEEHLQHLQLVIERLNEVGLKLQPVKCQFIWKEVEYLGHLVTPTGLKTGGGCEGISHIRWDQRCKPILRACLLLQEVYTTFC